MPVASGGEDEPLLVHLLALALDLVPALGRKPCQVVVERRVALVPPVELHAVAVGEAGLREGVRLRLGGEEHVRAGELGRAHQLAQHGREHGQERRPRGRIGDQEPRAGGGGEGDGDDELGVIGDARPLRGARPGPVEDELALAVLLQVGGRGGDEAVALPEREVVRQPAGVAADAAGRLQRVEPGVREERREAHAVERVPHGLGDGADRGVDADFEGHRYPMNSAACYAAPPCPTPKSPAPSWATASPGRAPRWPPCASGAKAPPVICAPSSIDRPPRSTPPGRRRLASRPPASTPSTSAMPGRSPRVSARYVLRGGSTLVAFIAGTESPATGGFRMIGAHTDSPNLRVKPNADVSRSGFQQVGVEVYGGVLHSTWMDRDLSLAGRVLYRGKSGVEARLVDLARPVARVANLAIHLNRGVNKDGLVLNEQKHLRPHRRPRQGGGAPRQPGPRPRDRGGRHPRLRPLALRHREGDHRRSGRRVRLLRPPRQPGELSRRHRGPRRGHRAQPGDAAHRALRSRGVR